MQAFTSFGISKYLQDQNYENTNDYKLALIDGTIVICEWNYTDISPPDLTSFDQLRLRTDFGLASVRKIRNDILDMTDKFILPDSPISLSERSTILVPYRQALRDITTSIRNGSVPEPNLDDQMTITNRANIFPVIPTMTGNYLKFIKARYRWMRYAGDSK